MGKQEELAKFIRQLRRERTIRNEDWCVVSGDVFFPTLGPARIAAKKYGKELQRVDGQISGWLVKDKK